jgi:hypothetical protein
LGVEQRDIHVGKHYGFRDRPGDEGLQQVKVLEKVRAKWRVEWVDPNPGLVDYVKSSNLVVAWQDRTPFLRDEKRLRELRAACALMWPGHDHPISDAVNEVLRATGEDLWVDNYGVFSGAPDVLERVGARARFTLPDEPLAFTDRRGDRHHTFDIALAIARAFASVEPRSVLDQIDLDERRYETELREPGGAHLLHLVQRWRATWALCRQWAGFDEAIAQRDAEIQRLRRIIDDLRWELRHAGQDDLAAKLDRKAKGT